MGPLMKDSTRTLIMVMHLEHLVLVHQNSEESNKTTDNTPGEPSYFFKIDF